MAVLWLMLPVSSGLAQTPGFSGRLLDINRRLGEGVFWTDVMLNGNGITSANVQSDITDIVEAADFAGNVAGQFTRDLPYPGGTTMPGGNGEDFGVLLEADVVIPPGTYQVAFGSDDAGWLQIQGVPFSNRINQEELLNGAYFGMFNDHIWYDDTRGLGWTGGTIDVAQETTTRLRAFFMENGGGDVLEVAIRDASTFETFDIGNSNLLERDLDNWVVLEDGALGWSVTTDLDPATVPFEHIGGKGLIGAATRSGDLSNIERGTPEVIEGKALLQRWNIPGRGGNFDSIANARNFIANNAPAAEGLVDQIIWSADDFYPAALGYPFARGNSDNYGVLVSGEVFVPAANVQFKDGNDDFAGLVIDLDGNGTLEDTEIIIEDDMWTNMEGQDNGGSPVSFATFTNLPAEGAWRQFEFYMGEGGGGDSGHLAWDQNESLTPFPFANGDPLTQEHTIRSSSLRTTREPIIGGELSASLVGDVSTVIFEVDVEEANWDSIGVNNPAPGAIMATLNVDGANIVVDVVNGTPTDGFTVDLVDDSVDEIVGTPTFSFTFGDPGDWDVSDFLNTGSITFGAGPGPGIAGDYNNNGQVEQGDLDLVLLNWGTNLNAPWVTGSVDQAELDGVLLNWGNTAALGSAAGVPEPSALVLMLMASAVAVITQRRRLAGAAAAVLALSLFASTAAAQTPGFTGRLLDVSETLDEHSEALGISRGVGLSPAIIQSDITDLVTVADLGGGNGVFPPGAAAANPYPGGVSTPGDGNDFVVTLEAMVTIPAGTWQIAYGTDDGGALQLNGVFFDERFNEEDPVSGSFFGMHSDSLFYDDNRGQGWTSGVFTVSEPTTTRFFHSFHERGGGDVTEVAIRDASLFSVDVSGGIDPVLDEWVLLEDGALGWEVMSNLDPAAVPRENMAGMNLLGTATRTGTLQNVVSSGGGDPIDGQVRLQRWNIPGRGGNFDSIANARNYIASNNPVHEGTLPTILWDDGELYPAGLGFPDPFGGESNYGVRITGEIFVTSELVDFKDANDDFTGFIVDLDGDGTLEDSEIIIDDDTWTDSSGDGNGGSPVAFASFSNLPAEGEWRAFEFYHGEGGGGDNGGLYWNQNETEELFPFISTDPLHIDHLIRPESYRTTSPAVIESGEIAADLVGSVPNVVFEVDADSGQSDSVGISGNPDPDVVTSILNVDGANIIVSVTGTPAAGFTADLVDDSVDMILGTPTFVFEGTDEAMWDTSQFATSGILTFTGGVGAAAGIPEPSSMALAVAAASAVLAGLARRKTTSSSGRLTAAA